MNAPLPPYIRKNKEHLMDDDGDLPGVTVFPDTLNANPDGTQIANGPDAPKDAFPTVYPAGKFDEQQVATAINGAMQGKLNAINQKFMAIGDVPTDFTHFTVFDVRVSPQSMVILQPESDSAFLLTLHEIAKGYFNVGVNAFLLGQLQARGSMRTPDTWQQSFPTGTTPTLINFSQVGSMPLEYMTFDDATDSLTSEMGGLYTGTFTLNGFNTSPVVGTWNGDWTVVHDNTGSPTLNEGACYVRNDGTRWRMSYFDNASGDRTASLNSVQPGDIVVVDGLQYTIQSANRTPAYGVEFIVNPGTRPPIGVETFTFQGALRFVIHALVGGTEINSELMTHTDGQLSANFTTTLDLAASTTFQLGITHNGSAAVDLTGSAQLTLLRIANSPTHQNRLPQGSLGDVQFKYAVIG